MLVPAALLTPRPPRAGEDYDAYLESFSLLDRGFAFGELVRAGPRHVRPPREMWPAMVPTLALALELRSRMVSFGARGLNIAAAYRPTGGASDSRHKHNAALDLDLVDGDERLQLRFVEVAAGLWREHQHLRAGAGSYAPDGRRWSSRIHLDTGWRFRCWQGIGDGRWSQHPAILELAYQEDDVDQPPKRFVAGVDEECVRAGAVWPSPQPGR